VATGLADGAMSVRAPDRMGGTCVSCGHGAPGGDT